MKTLILSDEMYARLAGLPGVADVLAGTPVPMPSDRDLVLAARIGETPLAFERTVEYRDAGRQAAEDTRLDLGEMIHHAHAAGVGPANARAVGEHQTATHLRSLGSDEGGGLRERCQA